MAEKKDDKAGAAVEAKQDAAYGKYEKDQATFEKKHPGEIDEAAYKKYEQDYDKAEAHGNAGAAHQAKAQKASLLTDAERAQAKREAELENAAEAAAKAKDTKEKLLAAEKAKMKSEIAGHASAKKLRLTSHYSFYDDDGAHKAWAAGDVVTDPAEIKSILVRQVLSPVLWESTIRNLMASGVDKFYEIGPGRVLAGLIKRVDRKAAIVNVTV